jgi:hypothetical protein
MDDSPSALLNAKFFSKISFAKGLTASPVLLKSPSIRESFFAFGVRHEKMDGFISGSHVDDMPACL